MTTSSGNCFQSTGAQPIPSQAPGRISGAPLGDSGDTPNSPQGIVGTGDMEAYHDRDRQGDTSTFQTAHSDTESVESTYRTENANSMISRRRGLQGNTSRKPRTTTLPPRTQRVFAKRSVNGDEPPATRATSWKDFPLHFAAPVKEAFFYSLSIFKFASQMMRLPFGIILFLLILAVTTRSVSGIFKSAFSPVCYVPVVNTMAVCRWVHTNPEKNTNGGAGKLALIMWADYQALVNLESKTIDALLDDSVGSLALTGSLSLNLKKTEIAVGDLIFMVKSSDLVAKDTLADALERFSRDAKVAVRSLSRLSANIAVVNDYALRTLKKARGPETLVGKLNEMMPWSPPRKDSELVIQETFAAAYDILSTEMSRLLVESEANEAALRKLEENLKTINCIIHHENDTITDDQEQVLARLWTKLGGNKGQLRSFQRDLALLKELTTYRKQALAHVVGASHTLQAMTEEMEDIRERVAAPDLAGSRVPPEVHMKSIQQGLKRMKDSRLKAQNIDAAAARKVMAQIYNEEERLELDGS